MSFDSAPSSSAARRRVKVRAIGLGVVVTQQMQHAMNHVAH